MMSAMIGLVQVANRRDPRATRSAITSDGAARAGGACLPTWASPGGGVRGGGRSQTKLSRFFQPPSLEQLATPKVRRVADAGGGAE